jgi:tripartite-type tricarboxylate transporter receptor subunit TctC
MKELIEFLRASPNKYSYASVGNGTSPHLSAELLWQMTGVKVMHVPYKGSAPAMTDLLGGQIPLLFDNISASVPHVKAGKIRALGVTTAVRSPSLPDVPTFAESGIDGYEVSSWAGLVGPANMSPAIVKLINKDTVASLRDPEVAKLLLAAGVTAKPTTPEEFASFISSQNAKFRAIAHRANLQIG